jgi:hypothetical protein
MNQIVSRCSHCGANLTPADLMLPSCRYCGTALPHQVAAAQQSALVQQMLQDRNGDGIPDAFAPMVHGALGGPPGPYAGPPPGTPAIQVGPFGAPVLGSPPAPGPFPQSPYAPMGYNPVPIQSYVQASMKSAQRTVLISIIASIALTVVITLGVLAALLFAR